MERTYDDIRVITRLVHSHCIDPSSCLPSLVSSVSLVVVSPLIPHVRLIPTISSVPTISLIHSVSIALVRLVSAISNIPKVPTVTISIPTVALCPSQSRTCIPPMLGTSTFMTSIPNPSNSYSTSTSCSEMPKSAANRALLAFITMVVPTTVASW